MSETTYIPAQREQIQRAVNKWFEAYEAATSAPELDPHNYLDDYDFKNELSETFPDLSFTYDPSSKSWLIIN